LIFKNALRRYIGKSTSGSRAVRRGWRHGWPTWEAGLFAAGNGRRYDGPPPGDDLAMTDVRDLLLAALGAPGSSPGLIKQAP